MVGNQHLIIDTSAVVALVASWHERHKDVRRVTERFLNDGLKLGLAAHTLLESYAVLTRLPSPYRLSAANAYEVLAKNFEDDARLQTIRSNEYWPFLRDALDENVTGGRLYDAFIARAAARLAPGVLLTLNPRHFATRDVEGLTIVTP